MTSSTTAGFTISASTEYNDDYAAWKACINTNNCEWAMKGNTFPSWWQVQCPSPVTISHIQVSKRIYKEWIDDFTFEGSNDGLTWITLISSIGQIASIENLPGVLNIDINDPTYTPYSYYRIHATSGTGPNPGFTNFQMYGYK